MGEEQEEVEGNLYVASGRAEVAGDEPTTSRGWCGSGGAAPVGEGAATAGEARCVSRRGPRGEGGGVVANW